MDGQKNIADTWITSRRTTSPAAHVGKSGTGTRTPSYWNAYIPKNERAKGHSMKHCEQTWNGTAKIGDPTGRKLPLHQLHNLFH